MGKHPVDVNGHVWFVGMEQECGSVLLGKLLLQCVRYTVAVDVRRTTARDERHILNEVRTDAGAGGKIAYQIGLRKAAKVGLKVERCAIRSDSRALRRARHSQGGAGPC